MEEKHENYIAAVRKREMLAATNVKKAVKKQSEQEHNISSIKRVNMKLKEVSR